MGFPFFLFFNVDDSNFFLLIHASFCVNVFLLHRSSCLQCLFSVFLTSFLSHPLPFSFPLFQCPFLFSLGFSPVLSALTNARIRCTNSATLFSLYFQCSTKPFHLLIFVASSRLGFFFPVAHFFASIFLAGDATPRWWGSWWCLPCPSMPGNKDTVGEAWTVPLYLPW